MKKILFLFTFLYFILTSTLAQDGKLSLGIKGGLNIATVTKLNTNSSFSGFGTGYSYSAKNPVRFLPHVGIYGVYKFSDVVSLQPELLFMMKGYAIESHQKNTVSGITTTTDDDNKVTLSYIELPIQIRVDVKKFFFLGGPSFGFLMSFKSKSKTEVVSGGTSTKTESTYTDKGKLNTMEVGMYLGLGYQLESGLNFGVRWNKAFTSLADKPNFGSNSVIQISVGYRLLSK